VLDVLAGGQYRYLPSPLAVGIFEMTMMRTRGALKSADDTPMHPASASTRDSGRSHHANAVAAHLPSAAGTCAP
jgi:hypothetical protein